MISIAHRPRPDQHPIARLRRIAANVADGNPLEPSDGAWLADKVHQYIAEAPLGATLDSVFDLAPAPGQLPWWSVENLDNRNRLIVEAARQFFPDLKPSRQAAELARRGRRYEASAWRRDRQSESMPRGYYDRLDGVFFALLSRHGGMPGKRQIERILKAGNGLSMTSTTGYSCHRDPVSVRP